MKDKQFKMDMMAEALTFFEWAHKNKISYHDALAYLQRKQTRERNNRIICAQALANMKVGQTFGLATPNGIYEFKMTGITPYKNGGDNDVSTDSSRKSS